MLTLNPRKQECLSSDRLRVRLRSDESELGSNKGQNMATDMVPKILVRL